MIQSRPQQNFWGRWKKQIRCGGTGEILRTFNGASNRKSLISYLIAALIGGLYLAFCAYTPISIYGESALDDELYLVNGQYLAAGNWLGPFSFHTLAKGPGYPLFLAGSAWTGLPITVSQAIFSCLAVGALALVVKRLSGSRLAAFAIGILLLWNPGPVQHGITRDAIYPAQTLLFIAVLTYALFCAPDRKRAVLWGLIAGTILGWFWLTREEGVWILPAVMILTLGAGLNSWLRARTLWLPTSAALSMPGAFALMLLGFRLVNYTAYGSFVGVDFKESNFVNACQALQNVRVGKPIPYLPVPKQVRQKIYQVSPAFASLRENLDPAGAPIAQSGCGWYPWTCGDIAGGWFLWALRDAAAQHGHYQTPAEAGQFFGEIHDQVLSACQQGLLVCDNWKLALVPHLSLEQVARIPGAALVGLYRLLFLPPSVIGEPSNGSVGQLLQHWRFLNRPVHVPMAGTTAVGSELAKFSAQEQSWLGRRIDEVARPAAADSCLGQFGSVSDQVVGGGARVEGWAWSRSENITPRQIVLVDQKGTIVGLASGGLDRPDVVAAGIGITDGTTGWQGFSKAARSVSAYAMIEGGRDGCRLTGTFDIVPNPIGDQELDPSTDSRMRLALSIRALLGDVYEFLLPPLFGIGLMALAFSFVVMDGRRAAADPIFWLAIALWSLIPTRLLLLAVIDVSSFPAMFDRYMAPLYLLITAAPLLSIWIAANQLRLKGWWPSTRTAN